jgi:glycosyltransferase involved in cell wall biosynthesis
MRILHVVAAFPRGPDDVIAPWLVELLVRLQAAGHDVAVFAPAYRGGGNASFRNIPIHRFRYAPARWEDLTHDEATPDRMRRSPWYKLLAGWYVVAGAVSMWRLMRQERYDVVHVHWPMPHAVFGWVARLAGGARIVTKWYGVELRWVKHSLPWLRPFLRWALRQSDQVVANSTHTAAAIREVVPVDVRVIPDLTTLRASVRPPDGARRGAGDAFRILFVGRLVERKGVTHLIEALRQLPPAVPAEVTIVGDGPERSRLEAQAASAGLARRVRFAGRVSDDDLRDAYAAAHVLVLPAVADARGDTEGLGVVLLEAMSFGVPVVASAIAGITDIIDDGRTGLLVPPGDPAALAAALRRLAEELGLAARLGDAGRRHVATHFTWDAILAQWEECYAAAAGRRIDTASAAVSASRPPRTPVP